jgi:hypothetical protein
VPSRSQFLSSRIALVDRGTCGFAVKMSADITVPR